jgi:hypothetical protein
MRPASLLSLGIGLCLLVIGCDDAGREGEARSSIQTPNATRVVFTVTDRPRGETTPVSIHGPRRIKAGLVRLTLRNRSSSSPHNAQVLRVTGEHSTEDLISNTVGAKPGRPIPAWVTDGAGVGTVNPGESATVIQVLRPGSYYLLDSESARLSHTLHARNGGVAKFNVVGQPHGDLPETTAHITADEYSFSASGIRPGTNWVTFENVGEEFHHLIAFPYRPGATYRQVVEDLYGVRESGSIPLNRDLGLGTTVLNSGQKQLVRMKFEKGKYALVCFVADRSGGRSHLEQGMITELTVE